MVNTKWCFPDVLLPIMFCNTVMQVLWGGTKWSNQVLLDICDSCSYAKKKYCPMKKNAWRVCFQFLGGIAKLSTESALYKLSL